jgi:hypothetical protein
MVESSPTTGELLETGIVTEDDLWRAAEAYLIDPETTLVLIGADYRLNLQAAIDASVLAKDLLSRPDADDHLKRAAVRTAILLARPEKR